VNIAQLAQRPAISPRLDFLKKMVDFENAKRVLYSAEVRDPPASALMPWVSEV
jgi:hypothetical protein